MTQKNINETQEKIELTDLEIKQKLDETNEKINQILL